MYACDLTRHCFLVIPAQEDYAASVLAIFHQFSYDIGHFTGAKVHSLDNLITMSLEMRDAFNQLSELLS